jgi:hypothetical protein
VQRRQETKIIVKLILQRQFGGSSRGPVTFKPAGVISLSKNTCIGNCYFWKVNAWKSGYNCSDGRTQYDPDTLLGMHSWNAELMWSI